MSSRAPFLQLQGQRHPKNRGPLLQDEAPPTRSDPSQSKTRPLEETQSQALSDLAPDLRLPAPQAPWQAVHTLGLGRTTPWVVRPGSGRGCCQGPEASSPSSCRFATGGG